jgi:hypothetical protein
MFGCVRQGGNAEVEGPFCCVLDGFLGMKSTLSSKLKVKLK